MADQRISQLTALPKASVAATDVLPITDISASETKKVTAKDLVDAGLDLVDDASIDLAKLDSASTTKLPTAALADDAVTAAKLANDSSVAVDTTAPVADNFEGRGYFNSSSGNLQIHDGTTYQQVVMPEAGIAAGAVTESRVADGAITTAKIAAAGLGTAAYADGSITVAKLASGTITAAALAGGAIEGGNIAAGAVGTTQLADAGTTYAKIQDTSASDVVLGRSSAGGGTLEEISCTAAGRALLDDADATEQRATLGLGTLATASGTWVDGSSFSGTSSGTNTGDQTITLAGDLTGSGTAGITATVLPGAITTAKVADAAVSTAKLQPASVTGDRLADNSAVIISSQAPTGTGDFLGQGWLNTTNNIAYRWDGSAWTREAGIGEITVVESTPLALEVTYPDAYSATLTITPDTQSANSVWAGPTSGADAAPTFRALEGADLPDATVSSKGGVIPGTGLAVDGSTLNHSNAVTGATVSGITFDNQGHVTAAVALEQADIPALDAAQITTGTFGTAFITDDAVTADKMADYSTAQIGETLPVADFTGQIFFNPLDKAFFMWDGNVWQPIGISQGSIILAGTYNATTNQVASVTSEGAAIGLTVGSALPAASADNSSYYVVVSVGGTGTSPAPTVTLAPPDLVLSDGTNWYEIDVSSGYATQNAVQVTFVPSGAVAATNVQAAIEEVSTDSRNASNIDTGALAIARGGTGQSSYTKGDIIAASGATTLGKLPVGTNGQSLIADSTQTLGVRWGDVTSGTVTSVTSSSASITVANGTTTPALTIRAASTSQDGVVQLSDSTSTTSSVLAATPTAVKAAYDLAAAALPTAGGTISGNVENTSTGYFDLPVGTQAQRPVTPAAGMVRFNSDIAQYEGYNGAAWGTIGGGAKGGGSDQVFFENDQSVSTNYTITSNKNAMTAGPVTVAAGVTVTVPAGSSWSIV